MWEEGGCWQEQAAARVTGLISAWSGTFGKLQTLLSWSQRIRL